MNITFTPLFQATLEPEYEYLCSVDSKYDVAIWHGTPALGPSWCVREGEEGDYSSGPLEHLLNLIKNNQNIWLCTEKKSISYSDFAMQDPIHKALIVGLALRNLKHMGR